MTYFEDKIREQIAQAFDDVSVAIKERIACAPIYESVATLAKLRDELEVCLNTLDMASFKRE